MVPQIREKAPAHWPLRHARGLEREDEVPQAAAASARATGWRSKSASSAVAQVVRKAQVGASKSARAPVVPQIRVKAKRIGLPAMRAGLNAKMGHRRASQRRLNPPAVGRRNLFVGAAAVV